MEINKNRNRHGLLILRRIYMSRRIIFIGAAGEMCRLAIERFAKAKGDT